MLIYDSGVFKFIATRIRKMGLKKVGFEAKAIPYAEHAEFKKNLENKDIDFVHTSDLIANLRMIKNAWELKLISKSVKITEEAFSFFQDFIYEGLTEKFIAIELEKFTKIKSDLELAFPPVVASGQSSAQPHYSPQDNKIRRNQPILIDLGSKYCGYCSDLTRVFFLSKMPNYLKRIIDIVKKAKQLSIDKIREGVKIKEIDKAARSYIEKKGYGKFFGHSLGHGVGLEVHELPGVNSRNEAFLEEGMVFTVEPAIYIPGKFGIREESMVLVKKRKAEILDTYGL